jgi:hypothetical protein
MGTIKTFKVLATAVLATSAILAPAPVAHAAYDPLGTGTVKLTLNKGFSRFLAKNRVKLSAGSPAKRKGRSLTLPVAGGKIDPTIGKGEVQAAGILAFKNARRRVPLRKITVKAGHAPLIAKVGGSQLKLATSPVIYSERLGFGEKFTAKKLKLTAKLATRLNKKLRPGRPFRAGQVLGTLRSAAQPLTVTLQPSGKAGLDFAPTFLAKLDGLFVSVNPIFPAEHLGGSFSFPIISGGAISSEASLGTLRTGGDVEFLQLGGGQVFWHEQWFDLAARSDSAEANIQPSPPYAGKLGRVPLLDLGIGVVASEPAARTITLAGAPVGLQASTAAAFNQAFAEGKAVFVPGEAVGTLGFAAQGQ